MEIDAGRIDTALQCLRTHAALADHAFDVEVFHYMGLIGLLARGCGRSGRDAFVFFGVDPETTGPQ